MRDMRRVFAVEVFAMYVPEVLRLPAPERPHPQTHSVAHASRRHEMPNLCRVSPGLPLGAITYYTRPYASLTFDFSFHSGKNVTYCSGACQLVDWDLRHERYCVEHGLNTHTTATAAASAPSPSVRRFCLRARRPAPLTMASFLSETDRPPARALPPEHTPEHRQERRKQSGRTEHAAGGGSMFRMGKQCTRDVRNETPLLKPALTRSRAETKAVPDVVHESMTQGQQSDPVPRSSALRGPVGGKSCSIDTKSSPVDTKSVSSSSAVFSRLLAPTGGTEPTTRAPHVPSGGGGGLRKKESRPAPLRRLGETETMSRPTVTTSTAVTTSPAVTASPAVTTRPAVTTLASAAPSTSASTAPNPRLPARREGFVESADEWAKRSFAGAKRTTSPTPPGRKAYRVSGSGTLVSSVQKLRARTERTLAALRRTPPALPSVSCRSRGVAMDVTSPSWTRPKPLAPPVLPPENEEIEVTEASSEAVPPISADNSTNLDSTRGTSRTPSCAQRRAVQKTSASDLPTDTLGLIFENLPPTSLAAVSGVCRAWRALATRGSLWEKYLRRRGIDVENIKKPNLKSTFASLRASETRFRDAKFVRHDLHKHSWAVERVCLVDHPRLGKVLATGGWDGSVFAWRLKRAGDGADDKKMTTNDKTKENDQKSTANVWEPFRSFKGPRDSGWISALCVSSGNDNDQLLASGDTKGGVCVWGFDEDYCVNRYGLARFPNPGTLFYLSAGDCLSIHRDILVLRRAHYLCPYKTVRAYKTLTTFLSKNSWRHGGSVTAVCFLPTRNASLASASTDGAVKIWSVTTGVQLATLKGHTDVVWHVECFVSLSNETEIFLVTAGRDATARTWAVPISRANANANGESTPPGNGPGTDNGNFKRPDTSAPVTLTPKSTLRGHGDAVLGLAAWEPCRGNKGTIKGTNAALGHFSRTKNTITDEPEPPLLATCGADGVVVVWRVADGQIVSTLAGHKNGVLCAQFVDWSGDLSKQNPRIVTGSADHAVRVWCVFSGVCLGVMWDHGAPVTSIFARADALVTLAPGDGLMAYWRRVDCEDETNNSGSTPCFAGPITQDTQTLLDSNQEPPETTPKTRLPENLHPAMTLMDGAGSGFCACFALDKDVLAVGTKTGTVQVLDFRRNARGARRERGEMMR